MRKAGRLSNDDIANAMNVAKQGGLISQPNNSKRFVNEDPLVQEALEHVRMARLMDDAYEHIEQ